MHSNFCKPNVNLNGELQTYFFGINVLRYQSEYLTPRLLCKIKLHNIHCTILNRIMKTMYLTIIIQI